MAKSKKPVYEWHETLAPYFVCRNGDQVLNIYTYGNRPQISARLQVAYFEYPGPVWKDGRKVNTTGTGGWHYQVSAYCGTGHNMIFLCGHDDPIRSNTPAYASRIEAIRAALHELVEGCDKHLLIPSDSSRPYWGRSQGHYFSRPGREQLAYYMCLPEWEPMWKLLEEYNAKDDWLAEMRAPKKSQLSEQLSLF